MSFPIKKWFINESFPHKHTKVYSCFVEIGKPIFLLKWSLITRFTIAISAFNLAVRLAFKQFLVGQFIKIGWNSLNKTMSYLLPSALYKKMSEKAILNIIFIITKLIFCAYCWCFNRVFSFFGECFRQTHLFYTFYTMILCIVLWIAK